ncbi:class III poly(R)-hydroxyalkanoic acid synthase subunit PhaC [bacterium]|nr:class III poly(R)-hydroxyalkanoic acid synthase subunit PhaC [bacterium]
MMDTQWSKNHQAMLDEGWSMFQKVSRLPTLWQHAQRVKKGATPSEVVYEEDRLKVFHYLSDEPPRHKIPVVFVFALVNRPYILDLLPNKSVVEQFVNAGFDTYLIDWGTPTHADRHSTLDTYINGYLRNVVDFVNERTGAGKVNLLGYCMGGTMSTMFTALHPELVSNLILMAAGIDFETREGLLNMWADEEAFDVDAFVEAYGNCPPEFLQASFQMLKPVSNFIEKPIALMERMDNAKFVDEYMTMETWLNDNIPLPGELFREFVKYLYQKNLLVKNQMPVGRHVVNLKQITCPILNLMATQDDLVPCAQSEPLNDLVGSTDRKTMKFKAGHIGLAVSSRAQRELWPKVTEWLGERDSTS